MVRIVLTKPRITKSARIPYPAETPFTGFMMSSRTRFLNSAGIRRFSTRAGKFSASRSESEMNHFCSRSHDSHSVGLTRSGGLAPKSLRSE